MVAYLASEQCEHTHEIYSVGGGRFGRIFAGLTPGWFAGPSEVPTVEELVANIDQIRSPDGYIIPDSVAEEMTMLMDALRG